MRNEAKELIGDNINAELVPFSFTHKDGGEEIKPSPMAYVPNLWEKIQCLLEQNQDDHKGYLLSHKHQKYSTDKHNHMCTHKSTCVGFIASRGTMELSQRMKSGYRWEVTREVGHSNLVFNI